jgi:aminopeptidase N
MERRRFLACGASWVGAWFVSQVQAQPASSVPHLVMELEANPHSGYISVVAHLRVPSGAGWPKLSLGKRWAVTESRVNGAPRRLQEMASDATYRHFAVPEEATDILLRYSAVLPPPLQHEPHRGGAPLPASLSATGGFISARDGWYPDLGGLFTYEVSIRLPAGQKGLVAGHLAHEADRAEGYSARWRMPYPAERLDLITGPYVMTEAWLPLGQRNIRLRTWFFPELQDLASAYLADSARYIERYSRQIGDYPFDGFSVVASPTPTGYGMPTLTYLGRDVLRLPFIRATSLGHEVLHNWWGNGVFVDYASGNWSEGLTTFMADYAFAEDQGPEVARDMRMGWLRDLTAVPPGAETALTAFKARHDGVSSIIGYGKGAMVFVMLRDLLGSAVFDQGLRLLWRHKRFATASWVDVQSVFEEASGRKLDAFFDRWVRAGQTPAFEGEDPDYRVWRRVPVNEFPAILREVWVPGNSEWLVTDPDLESAARVLAQRSLESRPQSNVPTPSDGAPLLLVGRVQSIVAWLQRRGWPDHLPALMAAHPGGTAWVWAARNASNVPYVVVAVPDAEAMAPLARSLPHYGRQNWLVFQDGRLLARGVGLPGKKTR